LDTNEVHTLINALKSIVDENNGIITIPDYGTYGILNLKGTNYNFYFDLNRQGHRSPKCTFQLRETKHKSDVLLRVDLFGRPHINPIGNYKYSGQEIPCPHIHLADYKDFGISVAIPLSDPLASIKLGKSGTDDLVDCLKKVLHRINAANYKYFRYNENKNLEI
jgi:hypothetical protein